MSDVDGRCEGAGVDEQDPNARVREYLRARYGGDNRRIEDVDFDESLAVRCMNGTFVGRRADGIDVFRGIPFVGAQPTGELRWKPPVACVVDDGVFEAYHNAKSAYGNPDLETGSVYDQDEACLYLNVWRAAGPARKRPVMVWVHGGAFEAGGTVDPMFDCANLVRENPDVVFVTIAYRLGVFGFLHLSHLPDGRDFPDAQNLGTLDQVAALRWVHENIAGFGGDPDNVTIFGESAGSASVTLVPLVTGAQAYFSRVIAESGTPALTRSTEQAIACTNELMEALGCSTVADLMAIDARTLKEASSAISLRMCPERDGRTIPLDPYEAYAQGAASDIDLMVGCNKDEMHFFVMSFGVEGFMSWAQGRLESLTERMSDEERALIEGFRDDVRGEVFEPLSRTLDQMIFMAPLIRLSECQAKAGGRVYAYHFTPESSLPILRCGHATELPIVFDHPDMIEGGGRGFDEAFAAAMRALWIQFARCGDPTAAAGESPDGDARRWPPYDLEDRYVMVLDEGDIHPEREAELGIVDWERTYFSTRYYWV